MTPSQLQSYIRQQQQKRKQAIDAYNREVRRVNDHNRRVVENYNRAVRAYNSQVRRNRQRLQHEIARLNSSPGVTVRYGTYRTSVQTLHRSFAQIEDAADRGAWAADADLFDMAEAETANSVAVLNALNTQPTDGSLDDPSLRQTAIASELQEIDPDLDRRWQGALFALSPGNPDAARHFCTSAREVITRIVDTSVSDHAVKAANPDYPKTPNGGVSRRARIQYCLARIGQENDALTTFVDDDIENVITLFDDFNHATHGSAGVFDLRQLRAIKARVEHAIQFLYQIVRYSLVTSA